MKTKTTSVPAKPASKSFPHHVVAKRAYDIWLAQGQPVGSDYAHWLEAETQLRGLPKEERETLPARLERGNDMVGTEIERELDEIAPTGGQRSATSL
jgi:hypothetical protein